MDYQREMKIIIMTPTGLSNRVSDNLQRERREKGRIEEIREKSWLMVKSKWSVNMIS